MQAPEPNRIAIYTVLALAGTLGALSDAVLNQWARTGRVGWLIAAYLSWLVVATVVGLILRMGYFGFGTAIVLFLMVNSIAALIIDRAFFAGRVTTLAWVGMALALAAIACIELGRGHSAPMATSPTTPAEASSSR
jgi:hypothetical protein